MATWLTGISRQHRIIRQNAFLWCGLFLGIFGVMLGRLFWLEVVEGPRYRRIADLYHTRTVLLPATRGRLLDRNHIVLAYDDQCWSLFADPTLVKYPALAAAELAPISGVPEAELYEALTREVPFVWVKRDVPAASADDIRRLHLPGIQVRPDGKRYRVALDPGRIPSSAGAAQQLAAALELPADELNSYLDMESEGGRAEGNAAPSSAYLRLPGTFGERARTAVEELHFRGTRFEDAGINYSVGADPRGYIDGGSPVTPAEAAQALAPLLGMPADRVKDRLLFRPRFAWLKRRLTPEMREGIIRLQGTMYVAAPGKLFDYQDPARGKMKALEEAVNRLHDMLNDKNGAERISRKEIRRRLLPGAAPGALAVKLVDGKPSRKIAARLYAKDIAGVIYGLPGVALQLERRRHYPYGALASPTLGFVGYVGHRKRGAFGLELSQEETLRGADGHMAMEIDAHRRIIPERIHERVEPVDGRDVVLTLDMNIQQAAESELAKGIRAAGAIGGHCIALNPQTGEVLALASFPKWDANDPGRSTAPLVNSAISNFYEPGSTFKVVAAIGALEEKKVRPGQIITCCTGAMTFGSHVVHEAHHAHGQVDLARFLEQSCNICGATLAANYLGPELFLKWCRALGFGAPTGLEVANESPGSLNAANVGARITLANMGFGQSIAVTVPQLAAAYAVVPNGGEWVQPHLVMGRARPDGTVERVEVPRRRVCSPETAALLLNYFEAVVTKGTGKTAAIPGYRVAGKTGTAQKPGIGGYRYGKHIASFVAFMPVEDPRLLILVTLDEPKSSIYGGVVAAPIVREVGRLALQYLKIPPSSSPADDHAAATGPAGN